MVTLVVRDTVLVVDLSHTDRAGTSRVLSSLLILSLVLARALLLHASPT